nr:hypothetical protein [Tanacetum cinerariifolium]
MAIPPSDQRHQYLRYEGLQYTDADIVNFETRLARIYRREGQSVFTSRAWRRLFDIRGPLIHDLILEFFSAFMFGDAREFILALGLHLAEEMQIAGFGLYWAKSVRRIPDKGDLSAYWIGISYVGDFLVTPFFYTLIRDPMLRLCHILIACSIAGRSQAPKKVIVTDLFYLRGIDVSSVNAGDDAGRVTKEASVAPGGGDKAEEMPQAVPPPPRS